jgi:hypothetical protein
MYPIRCEDLMPGLDGSVAADIHLREEPDDEEEDEEEDDSGEDEDDDEGSDDGYSE